MRPALRGRPQRPPSRSVRRLPIYAAGTVVLIANGILRAAHGLYRARLLGLAGIEGAVQLSRTLRRLGARLLLSSRCHH
jgi:hypothetical protein